MSLMLHNLPVEMVYRILDHLKDKDLFLSINNVCQRLNTILNSYHRYQVNNIKTLQSFSMKNTTFLISRDYMNEDYLIGDRYPFEKSDTEIT